MSEIGQMYSNSPEVHLAITLDWDWKRHTGKPQSSSNYKYIQHPYKYTNNNIWLTMI